MIVTDYARSRRQSSSSSILTYLVFFVLLIIGAYLIISFISFARENETSTQVIAPIQTPTPTLEETTISSSLKEVVETSLKENKGTYGIYIENLKTNETYYQNKDISFDTASLYKLWVMGLAYERVREGTWKLTDVFSQDVKVLNEKFKIDEEVAEREEGTVTYSLENALTRMITISDNYSALLLAEKLRLSNVQAYLLQNGLTSSKVGTATTSPLTTANDVYLFYKKLYDGELSDEDHTQLMINLLKKQALNEKIPKNLPASAIVAHKTGELGNISHDAGIVYTENFDYIIVVLTESDTRTQVNSRIATLSKNVYDYFEAQAE